jgi:hypothetical protein
LTAAHVWEEVLRSADKIGITTRTGRKLPNEFLMDVAAITPCALPKTGGWDEWGLDIILLRIPPFYVATTVVVSHMPSCLRCSLLMPATNDR